MNAFEKEIGRYNGKGLSGLDIETIQVNIGLRCNLECVHCHVVSSPRRKEAMDWPTMEHVIAAAENVRAKLVDITGGARKCTLTSGDLLPRCAVRTCP